MATNKSLQYKKELIKAMEKCHGIISDACRSVGVSRVTYYEYYHKDIEFKTAVDEIECSILDYVEGKLFNLIDKGDVASTIFFMKTKAKKRGYIERQEIDHTGIPPATFNVTVDSSETAKTLEKLRNGGT